MRLDEGPLRMNVKKRSSLMGSPTLRGLKDKKEAPKKNEMQPVEQEEHEREGAPEVKRTKKPITSNAPGGQDEDS